MEKIIKLRIREYLLLTFLITWLCWGAIIIANQYGVWEYGTVIGMILFGIGGNGAPIASYFLLKKWGEIDGVKSYLKYHFDFRTSIKNYLFVMILIAIHFLIPISLASTSRQLPIYFGLILLPMTVVGGGLEEIGWRGILQPYLEKITSYVNATVLVAVVWSIWHLPLWFIEGTFQSGLSFMYFIVTAFGLTFSLAAIRKLTDNVFLCILFHSLMNSFWTVFNLEQNLSTILTAAVEIVLSLAIIHLVGKLKNNTNSGVLEVID